MKRKLIMIVTILSVACLFPNTSGVLRAEDFANNEQYYSNLCTQYNADSSVTQTCNAYRDWLSERSANLQAEVDSMNNNIAAIQNNIDEITAAINKQQKYIDQLASIIAENEAAIEKINGVIIVLEADIKQTEADIEQRDNQIKDRMVSEQVAIGTNVYVEFVMGAKDLVDMVRIADGIERITENDQEEIAALEEDKAKLNQQKEEQSRLKADQEKAKQENEENKKSAEAAKKAQEKLVAEYRKQEADLIQQMRSAQNAQQAVQSKIAQVDAANYSYAQSDGWIRPVPGAGVSAHTWQYPGGGLHLGTDFAAGVGTAIVAPIGGVIVYANNPVGSYSGYLNNWSGYPAGGGNTIHMVGTVNGTTYGISFFHMAQENFIASAGMAVSQGTQLGGVGHSGNSTGPHCHVEIFNLGNISVEAAVAQFSASGADFAWGNGWNSTATSCDSKGSTPCRVQPESIFGW